MSYSIEIEGLERLRDYFKSAPKRVKQELDRASKRSALRVQREARQQAPVDTGRLRSSIALKLLSFGAEIWPKAKYGLWVHEGTGVHARNGGGRTKPWVYKRSDGRFVRTIGTKANPFMERAAKLSEPLVRQEFEDAIERVVEAG